MKISLTIKNYRCFLEPTTLELTKGFTAFVGVNNAGKSAIMRFLLEFRPVIEQMASPGFLTAALSGGRGIGTLLHVKDNEEAFSNRNKLPIEFWFDLVYDEPLNPTRPTKLHIVVERNGTWGAQITTDQPIKSARQHVQITGPQNQNLMVAGAHRADLAEIYRVAGIFANTLFIGPFRNAINIGSNENYLDIKVGQAFIKQFRNLKTGPVRRQNEAMLRLTHQIKGIFEFDDLSIDASDDENSLHLTVNGRPFKQHELGSGLVQFILVLANASIRLPEIILIDEPELNLHPRLQLDFLTTLGSYAGEGGVWFSTHSIGLARSAAERIYSVVKRGDGDSIVRPLAGTPRLSEFLGEMSFSSHKDLGFEEILLVEGPTEVKIFQHFLRELGKDHKVVILPLHGRMPKADDLDEILRITTHIAAIIDSERTDAAAPLNKDRQEFVDLCQQRGIDCKVLDRRAMENYFPDSVVKSVFGPSKRALGPFEKFGKINPGWAKDQNWKLALAWPLADVSQTDLGHFLQSHYKPQQP
jgi:predicted ATPase